MTRKNWIPYLGLIGCLAYFITTAGLVVTGAPAFLTAMELATMLSSPILLLLLTAVPAGSTKGKHTARQLSIAFMACCMALTCAAHFVNLTVTRPLIDAGVSVPLYLQIGQWPSVQMAVDYLAWGFFMGAAFLCASFAVAREDKLRRALQCTLLACGALCLLGLLGAVLLDVNLWYIAPVGYGLGTVAVCFELLAGNKQGKRRGF